MQKQSVGLSKEGLPFLFLVAFFTLISAILESGFFTFIGFILTAFVLNFFRDPERVIPIEDGVAVAPADGKIVKIDTMKDPISGEERTAICIFMNVFNVHVNRFPVEGKVSSLQYWPGKFFNAALDKASEDNERCAVQLIDKDKNSWTVVQIAGLIARRIICWAEKGDSLARGERFGLIKFGSRVDLYLPKDFSPKVMVGEKVLAGQTIVAAKNAKATKDEKTTKSKN